MRTGTHSVSPGFIVALNKRPLRYLLRPFCVKIDQEMDPEMDPETVVKIDPETVVHRWICATQNIPEQVLRVDRLIRSP